MSGQRQRVKKPNRTILQLDHRIGPTALIPTTAIAAIVHFQNEFLCAVQSDFHGNRLA